MPSRRRGPSRQQLSRSALPSIQTLVGGSCGNGTGLRNRNGSAIGLPVPPTTALITPGPVRHCQIPDLPVDGSLFFEFLFFIYLLIVLFIQYINIYKTVWWYPYSHPASCTSLKRFLERKLRKEAYLGVSAQVKVYREDRVFLCSPGCPGTHSVDLKLRNPLASASQVLGLKACATARLCFHLKLQQRNFHLIDYYLAAFITVMLARRLVWALISEKGSLPEKDQSFLRTGWRATKAGAASMVPYTALILARLVLLTLCGWVLCWTLVNLFRSHSVLNLLFLGYPFGVYVPLYCFHQDSRAHLLLTDYVVQHQAVEEAASNVGSLARSKDFLSLLLESLKEQFNNATPIPTHSCPLSPDLIRNEVECLKADFNHRIKEVLFNSLFSAYYVAFLPLCFVKAAWMVEFGCIWSALIPLLVGGESTQYYDMRWSCEHLIMVWINAFVMLTTQLLPSKYCDLLHKSAAHLGKWQKLEHGFYSNAPQHMFLFHRPLRVLNLLILIEGSVVVYQLYSLLRSEKWNHTLSMALVLFCNYYVLFKLLRDRIVLGRAYSYPLNSYELKAN
ncbi:Transmembrane protein 39A [Apodemus speciosus]|uniref:Transmembrane protein 39A n=1 Tax=Apodemus speciosus TaxID=105296 RepID=A0ABQ0FM17_APOSI